MERVTKERRPKVQCEWVQKLVLAENDWAVAEILFREMSAICVREAQRHLGDEPTEGARGS
jgi:hypothetical protein